MNQSNSFGAPIGGAGGSFFQQGIFVAPNCAGGANTVTFNFGAATAPAGWVLIMEFGPLAAGSSIPFFGPLAGAQIPPINLAAAGNGCVGNVLKVINGGTGVTTSTGTGNTVLSASPTFTGTVALPAVTMTGKVSIYNNVGTSSNGVPAEYASIDLTAQAAAITATTLYAVPGAGVGMYRISWSADITTADAVSSTLGGANGFQVLYTSPTDSVVKTTVAQSDRTSAANTTGPAIG